MKRVRACSIDINKTGGWVQKLLLKGIGYKSLSIAKGEQPTRLFLDLGYSHYYFCTIPSAVKLLTKKSEIFFYSNDKELLHNFMQKIVKLREPDAYKGKGILYEGQVLNLKKGKQR